MKKQRLFLIILTLSLLLPATLRLASAQGAGPGGKLPSRPEGPCDIFAAAGTPCVSAHSTTRALSSSYNGPLYQVMRQSDGKTLDIGVVQPSGDDPGGYADADAQDKFCENTIAWISVIYDQSGNNNHLYQAPPGTFRGPAKGGFNTLPIADMAPVTVSGHKVYGSYIMPGMGLRNNDAKGIAINDEPHGIYMVFDGTHFDSGCCFNYGNTSTNSRAVGRGTMSTVYFGTSTAWGSGNGPGPWIMSDMEAGLFSGYDAKQNIANPTIDSWRFVTGMVNGGGGNRWEIRGGDAREGDLSVFYQGPRPGSNENNYYYPMHQKGAVQMGNGGDNGNGSAGTFYEGVVTSGYPADDAIKAVQENIVKAGYHVLPVSMTRITTFTPGSAQEVTISFTNSTGVTATGLSLSLVMPEGWSSSVSGKTQNAFSFNQAVAPDAAVKASFIVSSPKATGAGYITAKAEWKSPGDNSLRSESVSARVRNANPVTINEIRLSTSTSATNQFIELYNSSDSEVDISGWSLINTRSEWAPVKLAGIPAGTRIAGRGFYLLGLAGSGLAAPAAKGSSVINVNVINGFAAGQEININGEKKTIKSVGSAASPMTTVFVPVSTGPWITIPAGSSNLPVTSMSGFEAGQKIGIDMGGNYEEVTVTSAGKAATQTNLATEAKAGDTRIKVTANSDMTVGDLLTIGTGSRKEHVRVKSLINIVPPRSGRMPAQPGVSPAAGEVELAEALKFDHMIDVDVAGPGTGISFTPATRYEHKSGDAVQALGSGITLASPLDRSHEAGAPVSVSAVVSTGYQGDKAPDQWYGTALSTSAGSLALMDASGKVVVDAVVYGSQQSNSSANGTITSPELAVLEGDQKQGGCIVVAPEEGRGTVATTTGEINRSLGRYPDGADTDNNCTDFNLQSAITLLVPAKAGDSNLKVGSVTDLKAGQKIFIGSGTGAEVNTVTQAGTPGGTSTVSNTGAGSTVIAVSVAEGFNAGQTFTIGSGSESEKATVSSVVMARRRFGATTAQADSIKVTSPLRFDHASGTLVSGSGITLSKPLTGNHERGTRIMSYTPTPGAPNQYPGRP